MATTRLEAKQPPRQLIAIPETQLALNKDWRTVYQGYMENEMKKEKDRERCKVYRQNKKSQTEELKKQNSELVAENRQLKAERQHIQEEKLQLQAENEELCEQLRALEEKLSQWNRFGNSFLEVLKTLSKLLIPLHFGS
ncbi:hypothetical protein QOT17_007562 [Balamuthia mandrillaris]